MNHPDLVVGLVNACRGHTIHDGFVAVAQMVALLLHEANSTPSEVDQTANAMRDGILYEFSRMKKFPQPRGGN